MTKIIGRLNSLGIGKESSRGTAVSPTKWYPMMELDYEDKPKTVVDEASLARLEGSDDEVVVSNSAEVTMKSKVKDKSIGLLLLSLFGTVNSAAKSSPNAAVYDHTFSLNQTTQHQSLTLALKGPNDDIAVPNAVVDSLKITVEPNDYVKFEAHALGKPSASASNTVSNTQENDFTSKGVTVKFADVQADLDAASGISVRKLEVELKSNAELEEVLGSTPVNDVLNKSFEISGSITITHTDSTYKTLANAGTKKAIRLQFQNTGVTIGSDQNPTLVLDLHRCVLSDRKKSGGMGDILEESFNFKAHLSLTDSKMFTCKLTNLQSAY